MSCAAARRCSRRIGGMWGASSLWLARASRTGQPLRSRWYYRHKWQHHRHLWVPPFAPGVTAEGNPVTPLSFMHAMLLFLVTPLSVMPATLPVMVTLLTIMEATLLFMVTSLTNSAGKTTIYGDITDNYGGNVA
eukprot:2482132-Rhodomonas_salina.1